VAPSAFLTHLAFCALLAALSACVVRAMVAVRVLDQPDPRKAHRAPVPKGGGVGVVAAFLAGMGVLYAFAASSRIDDPYFQGVILASAAIAAVSLADDMLDWPFTVKLAAQLGAGLAAIASGLWVESVNLPGFGAVPLGWLGVPLSLGWLLLVTNAVNFIDGLNGLAAGACMVACLFLAAIAGDQGAWFAYFASLVLAAGLAGFLPFNFPRARIFLGDVGSQFCGFVLAVLGIAAGRFQAVPLSALLVPMLLSAVLWDVLFTLARRLLAGDRVTAPHRGHLYQLAHRTGVPAWALSVLYWGFGAWGGIVAMAFVQASPAWKPVMPLLVAPPLMGWTFWVLQRAAGRDIGHW
jgi:UDP-GlcNAc:undecaprenyl-phosphate GlcNAc-1-phosphate transferase